FSFSTSNSTVLYYDYPDYDYGRCVYEHHGASFLPALYSIFFILGLVGNSLVMWVIVRGTRLRSMTDVCLLNLAAADLLLVCTLPFVAHQAQDQWLFGDAMCKVILGIFSIAFYCGIFFVTLMSIDRYLAIVHAVYAVRARTRSFGMIAAAQFDGKSSMSCYPVFPKTSQNNAGLPHPHFWSVFSIYKMNTIGLFVPVVIMVFCYSQIIWRLYHSRSSKKQAIRLVVVVVAVFFCCWLPYNIASIFSAQELVVNYTDCDSSKAIRLALVVTEAIAYSHSCLNPILYVFVGEKFRRHLLRMISRSPCRLCKMVKVCFPQDRIPGSFYSQTTSLDERSNAI
uniref:G-protein coupled receptors family 1 profile domain-containing protein n=1 Tax=Mola mola TaxID=94237 RepID=A0A3Q3WFR8_MOLML